MFRLLTASRPPEQLHRTHARFLLQQTVTANATTLPATTTASGGTATTASTAENEASAETVTVTATSPAGTLSGTGNASRATETATATATGGVGVVKTTMSTRDVIATMTAGASAEGEAAAVEVEVDLGLRLGLGLEEVMKTLVVAAAVEDSAGPHAVATTTGASGKGGGGTETGWAHLRGGLRRRRKRRLCRRGSARRVGGMCTLPDTSSTRPCRRSRQVSDAVGYHMVMLAPAGQRCDSLWWSTSLDPQISAFVETLHPMSCMELEIDLRSRRSHIWVQSRVITHHHCRLPSRLRRMLFGRPVVIGRHAATAFPATSLHAPAPAFLVA